MDLERLKASVAPCGLLCETCFAHVDGNIRRLSLELKEALDNFEVYAKRFETLLGAPIFRKYPDFKEVLDYLAAPNCQGCRQEQCRLFKNCGVRACHQRRQIDYCHQCDEFPCNRTRFDERLYKVWLSINEKIKQVGMAHYYEEARTRPRYP